MPAWVLLLLCLLGGGGEGFIAGLGFAVADTYAGGKFSGPFSEKIMKWNKPNHMIHIYDFKKKHALALE